MSYSSIFNVSHGLTKGVFLLLLGELCTGCTLITDEGRECTSELKVRFVYDYNIKNSDAFAKEVTSVNVWAFDSKTGRGVWAGEAAGEQLKDKDFSLYVCVPSGTYDFVSWCGLNNNKGFDLSTYVPDTKEQLYVRLLTDTGNESSKQLSALFNAYSLNQKYEVNPYAPTETDVKMSLVKDTNDIRIMLQHLDGSAIDPKEFDAYITHADTRLEWNNEINQDTPDVIYRPWGVRYGTTETSGSRATSDSTRTQTTASALLFDFSTSRLKTDRSTTLVIHRHRDNTDIIRIPLVKYFLMVKGHYGEMGDQEYLDRQDDYSATFFLDANSNWYVSEGIYINGWAVIPPQEEEI